jgi:outer membrane protein assembly factor BamB
MKRHSLLLILILVITSSLLSACAGGPAATSSWPGVTVNGETAYVAYGSHVYAVNLSDGTQKWRYPEKADPNKTFFAAPALTSDGQLIAGTYHNTLLSINAANGQDNANNWPLKANNRFIASPLVTENAIYAPTASGALYALTLSGQPLWAEPFKASGAVWANPVADANCECLYLASMDHHLYAVDAQSGRPVWAEPLDVGGAMASAPVVGENGNLYVGTFGSELLEVDAETGQVLKRFATAGWLWAGPALFEGRLYFGDSAGNFYILEAADHTLVKKLTADGPIVSTPLVVDVAIYYTTEAGSIYAIDPDGAPIRNIKVGEKGEKLYTTPILAGDLLLAAPVGGEALLLAYNPDLSQKWAFIPPK